MVFLLESEGDSLDLDAYVYVYVLYNSTASTTLHSYLSPSMTVDEGLLDCLTCER